jgi:O-methyltransferase
LIEIKKVIKQVLRTLNRVFPGLNWDSYILKLFPLYKEIVRLLYGVKIILSIIVGNFDRYSMSRIVYKVMPYSLVGINGLETTHTLAKELNRKRINGSFIELGVAQGGCSALIWEVAFDKDSELNREVWLFDSFEGLPEPSKEDFRSGETGNHLRPLPVGSCLGELAFVEKLLFEKFRFPKKKVHIIKGWFKETLPTHAKKIKDIALLRMDGDWYDSTKICLDYFYDKVVCEGIVIIDDYESCFGCKKAVDEFITNKKLEVSLQLDGRGGGYFIKK